MLPRPLIFGRTGKEVTALLQMWSFDYFKKVFDLETFYFYFLNSAQGIELRTSAIPLSCIHSPDPETWTPRRTKVLSNLQMGRSWRPWIVPLECLLCHLAALELCRLIASQPSGSYKILACFYVEYFGVAISLCLLFTLKYPWKKSWWGSLKFGIKSHSLIVFVRPFCTLRLNFCLKKKSL